MLRHKSRTINALLILGALSLPAPLRGVTATVSLNLVTAAPPVQANRTTSPSHLEPDRDLNREKAILRELEKSDPNSVETFNAAAEAFDKKDYAQAVNLYRQVIEKAPDFDLAYRMLGSALASLGNSEEGLRNLERACKLNPSPENLIALAQFLDRPGDGTQSSEDDKLRALEIAKKARAVYQAQKRGNDPIYAITVAQLAFEVNDIGDARVATRSLGADHPDLPQTHYCLALLAAHGRDWEKAEEEIELARSLGLQDETARRFLDSGVRARARGVRASRCFNYLLYVAGVWIAGLAALLALGTLFSRLTLRSIDDADPNAEPGAKEISLRSRYKRLIDLAVVYYYISPPVMVFLAVAAAGALIYGLIGNVPMAVAMIVGVVAATPIYKMVHSLFIKIEREDTGRALNLEEAPGLWALTREVAQAVRARQIDEIRITTGCDLTVYERGGLREKTQDRATRVLTLGVEVLDGMKQNAFRALLAHEYGHFSRQGAGGDVARRLTEHIWNFIFEIESRRCTCIVFLDFLNLETWNIFLRFLGVYESALHHIALGSMRLQSILADRVAAQNYGSESLEEGARHIIRREVELDFKKLKEFDEEIAAYGYKTKKGSQLEASPEGVDQRLIEKKINDIIARPTSKDAAHPSPADRFRLIQRIISNNPQCSDAMVWDLFASRESLMAEMSELIKA